MFISNTLPLPLLIILILNFTGKCPCNISTLAFHSYLFKNSNCHTLPFFPYKGATALRCAYLKLEISTEESPDLESLTADSSAVEASETKSVHCSQEGSYCFALWHLDTKPTTSFPSLFPSSNEAPRHRLIAAGTVPFCRQNV